MSHDTVPVQVNHIGLLEHGIYAVYPLHVAGHVGHVGSSLVHRSLCTQFTKAYVADTSYNQLLLILLCICSRSIGQLSTTKQ